MTTTKTQKTIIFASILAAVLGTGTFATTVEAEEIKDYTNYEAQEIMKELAPYLIQEQGKERILSDGEIKEKDRLQVALNESIEKHKSKHVDPALMNKLHEAKAKFIESEIPYKIVGISNDKLVIQLAVGNDQYESAIDEMLQDYPYKVEYGEGVKRGACNTTHDDCDPEQGGIEIQIKKSSTQANTCSLSIPMERNSDEGFLTAGHCFTGYSENVYQADTGDGIIGSSSSSWREYGNNLDCDCAWIEDTSATTQQNGIWAFANNYYVITGTAVPGLNDEAMYRGQHNNNGIWYQSDTIDVVAVNIEQDGITTTDTMGFPSPFQGGDSGGGVFYNGDFIGIAVAEGIYNGEEHVFFVPWDNVDSSISGLGL